MSRPVKIGLDYFPLDTHLDDKFELLEARHGVAGFGIIIKLFQCAYREYGYFYPWTEREQLLFCRRVNVDINEVSAVIHSAIAFGIFDRGLSEKGILTSSGMQKRFIEASKRRMEIDLYRDLLLVNVNIIPVNVGNNPRRVGFNDYIGTHIKLKESKEEKRREEASQATPDLPRASEVKIPPEAINLSSKLLCLHQGNIDPGFKATPRQLEAWAADIDKLHRLDGREWADIEAAIEWIKTPGCFWAPNIISGATLRKQFSKVIGQMKNAPGLRVLSRTAVLEMEG